MSFVVRETYIKKQLVNILGGQVKYCWWLKSCTTKDDDYPIIYRVSTIPGGAGLQPSTVWNVDFCPNLMGNDFTFGNTELESVRGGRLGAWWWYQGSLPVIRILVKRVNREATKILFPNTQLVWYIHLHEWWISMVNVGRYTDILY